MTFTLEIISSVTVKLLPVCVSIMHSKPKIFSLVSETISAVPSPITLEYAELYLHGISPPEIGETFVSSSTNTRGFFLIISILCPSFALCRYSVSFPFLKT